MSKLFSHKQALCAAIILIAGMSCICGCNRGPRMYQVSGKVHYKNGADPRAGVAVVNFIPAKESTAEIKRAASGPIQKDGSFEMYTRVFGDGVHAGDYMVTFTVQKGPMDNTPLITLKYMNPTTTPYKITVDGNKADLDYEVEALPSAGGPAARAQ